MSLTNYLLVVLIALIILLTITYTTDFTLPINLPKMFESTSALTSSSSDIEYEKIKKSTQQTQQTQQPTNGINDFLIDTNFAYVDDFAMTENTGNVIADALKNI